MQKRLTAATFIIAALFYTSFQFNVAQSNKLEETEDEKNEVEQENKELKESFDNLLIKQKELRDIIESKDEKIKKQKSNIKDLENEVEKVKKEKKKIEEENKKLSTVNEPRVSSGSKVLNVEATAYTSFCPTGCIGKTATGVDVSNSITYKGERIIAVDPNTIPLHSKVRVHPNDGSPFVAYAMDTGGDIKGNRIDVLVSVNDRDKTRKFGRQKNVKVEILKEGK